MHDSHEHLEPWWEVTLPVPHAAADDISALLVDDGALGVQVVSEQQQRRQAWDAHPSMGPGHDGAPLGVDRLSEQAPAPTAHSQLLASFAGTWSEQEVMQRIADTLAGYRLDLSGTTPQRRTDSGWAHVWRKHFKPMKVGRRLWIVPSWEDHFAPPAGSVVLPLDPGMAFGTGQHATTALCLRAIETLADTQQLGKRILDVGCGSGVLAMAALALGAQEATLVDIDAAALSASQENLERAGFANRFAAVGELPAATAPGFALVVANILAPVLCEMSAALVAQVAPGGTLLLSGILQEQAQQVATACRRSAKLQGRAEPRIARLQHDAWVALRLDFA